MIAGHDSDLPINTTRMHDTRMHETDSRALACLGSRERQAGMRGAAALIGPRAWIDWLRTIKWDWFITLRHAGAGAQSCEGMRRAAIAWADAMRAHTPRAYACVVTERGRALGQWHAHVLLGGVGTHPAWVTRARALWAADGNVHIVRFNPRYAPVGANMHKGACAYVVKDWPNAGAELDVIGRWRKHRARVRRARGTVDMTQHDDTSQE